MKQKLNLLLVALFVVLFSLNANAYDFKVDGIFYNKTSYGTCEVTNSGNSYSGDVVIPSSVTYGGKVYSVTALADNAFSLCDVTSVTLPNSVTTIGKSAFSFCSSLTSVSLGSSVTSISNSAFMECTSLTSVTIPSTVTSIDSWAFEGCTSLTSVTIPDAVTTIGSGAFSGCSALTEVTIPASVTSISGNPFDACGMLEKISVDLNNHYYKSVDDVLFDKDAITLIAFPGGRTGSYDIPNTVTTISDGAFSGCSGLSSVSIGTSVTSLGSNAFSGCSSLTSVTIPNSIKSISLYAFSDCSKLSSVNLGDSVNSIGQNAFSRCSSLTSVTLPSAVNSIGSGAFSNCNQITTVTSLNETPPELSLDAFTDDVYNDAKLYVPQLAVDSYKNSNNWWFFKHIEGKDGTQSGVKGIARDAAFVTAHNGSIEVTGTDGTQPTEVYDAAGHLLYSGKSTRIAVPQPGSYIVRIASRSFKVVL